MREKLLIIFLIQISFIFNCTEYIPCDPGYSLDAKACFCRPCPAGNYNGDKDGVCKNCSPGTYSEKSGSGYCEECPVNTYNPNYGSKSKDDCIQCEEELYSIPGSGKCVEKSKICTLYTFNYYCTSCDLDDLSKCASCEDKYYLENGECKYCGFHCEKCTSNEACEECENNYIFDNSKKQCIDKDEYQKRNDGKFLNSYNFYFFLFFIFMS